MQEPADIFLWANTTEGIKDDLKLDLFLINKQHTVYSIGLDTDIASQSREWFLLNMLKQVELGVGLGMSVRNFEQAEAEDNVIQRAELQFVAAASEVIHQIENAEADIEPFREADHEFKRIKAMIARFSRPGSQPFYAVKLVQQSQTVKGASAWSLSGNRFGAFEPDVALRVQPDSQVLILDGYIFVFNQAKFEKIFNYDVKKQAIADKKVAEIEAQFRLSFADGQSLNTLIKGKKRLINKLQNIDPSNIKQEDLENHAETMGLELLNDDSGAIIILDDKDLDTFITLLNDDYITSDMTGIRYKISGKKPLEEKSSTIG